MCAEWRRISPHQTRFFVNKPLHFLHPDTDCPEHPIADTTTKILGALLAAVLTACGGGGSSPPPPPPVVVQPANPAAPLDLSKKSATTLATMAGTAPNAAEALLMVGRFAIWSSTSFADSAAPVTIPSERGSVTLTLTDRDANGRASAGDSINVSMNQYGAGPLGAMTSGSVVIDVAAGVQPSAQRLKALVRMNSLTYHPSGDTVPYSWQPKILRGSFELDWTATETSNAMRVASSAADDVQEERGSGSAAKRSAWRSFDVTRTLSYTDALIRIGVTLRLDSEAHGGSLQVNTLVPLTSRLNMTPHLGRLEIVGANAQKLYLSPLLATPPNRMPDSDLFQVDAAAVVGGNDAVRAFPWSSVLRQHLWKDELYPIEGALGVLTAEPYDPDLHQLLPFPARSNLGLNERFPLQFSVDMSTAQQVDFRFECAQMVDGQAREIVAAKLERNGARWTVQPVRPLMHNGNCYVMAATDGVTFQRSLIIADANGKRLVELYSLPGFRTVDYLHPAIEANGRVLFDAAAKVRLSGLGSSALEHPVVSYQWTQVENYANTTPLTISTPNGAETDISWGAAPPRDVEPAKLRLTIKDSAGNTRQTDYVVLAANLAGATSVLYVRQAPGFWSNAGSNWSLVFTNVGGTFSIKPPGQNGNALLASFNQALHSAGPENGALNFWDLTLQAGDKTPLKVGLYDNTVGPYPYPAAGRHQLALAFANDCNPQGRFTVLEVAYDASGNYARLAVDFEHRCVGYTVPMFGSLRINSTIPLRL